MGREQRYLRLRHGPQERGMRLRLRTMRLEGEAVEAVEGVRLGLEEEVGVVVMSMVDVHGLRCW